MSYLRQWNRDFLLEFIEVYRSFPCLWKIKSAEYRDRIKKNKAYDALLIKCKEIDSNVTVNIVKQKIDSLRGAFRKELKKVKDSSKSGAGSEDIYKPHLWYYENLLFLTDHEMPRAAVGNLEDEVEDDDADENNTGDEISQIETERESESTADILEGEIPDAALRRTNKSRISSAGSVSSRDATTPSTRQSNKSSYRSKRSRADDILDKVDKQLDRRDDQFDAIGKTIAHKLRSLPSEVAVVTEKMINDILFESQIGNVDRYSRINIYDSRPYPPDIPPSPIHRQNDIQQRDSMSHSDVRYVTTSHCSQGKVKSSIKVI